MNKKNEILKYDLEVAVLLDQVKYYDENSRELPDELRKKYEALNRRLPAEQRSARPFLDKVVSLCVKGELSAALDIVLNCLKENPNSIEVYRDGRRWFHRIANEYEAMGKCNPFLEDLDSSYFKLKKIGVLGLGAHLIALRHFTLTNKNEKARELLAVLKRISPTTKTLIEYEEVLNVRN